MTALPPTNRLVAVFPPLRRLPWARIPLSRDQLMLLMAALNGLFIGFEHYLAHSISGTIRPAEWIPIVAGPAVGVVLLVAGLIALRYRPLATTIGTLTLAASIVVGLLGAYFHWVRAILPSGPAGQRVSLDLLVWAPPILGPLFMSLVGVVGISAVWAEDPPGSGTLLLLRGRHLTLPYSKTQAYLFLVGLGALAALISSVLDHARTGFENPWLWVPVVVGVFATGVSVILGLIDRPSRADLAVYAVAMLLLVITGVLGAYLHIRTDLVRESTIVVERFIRGAPLLAPMLFSNIGAIGLIVLLEE